MGSSFLETWFVFFHMGLKIFLMPVIKICLFTVAVHTAKSGMAAALLAGATAAKYLAPTFLTHHIPTCSPDEQKFPVLASVVSGAQAFVLLVLGVRKVSLVSFHLCWQK